MKNPCGCEFNIKAKGPFPWIKYKQICLQHSQEYFIIVVNDLIERTYHNTIFQLQKNILEKKLKDDFSNLQDEMKKDQEKENKILKDNKKAHDEFMKFFFGEDDGQ